MQKIWSKSRLTVLGLVLAGVTALSLAGANQTLFTGHVTASLKVADPTLGPSKNSFAPIVKSVAPTVVNISSSKVVRTPNQVPGQMEPFFRQFFGDEGEGRFNIPRERREQSLGSGVIVAPEGYILTNNHVVDGATNVKVMLADKREYKAAVVGTDPKTDIAVLKIDGSNFPSVTIGDSSKVQVGDYALALGNPFGVGQSVTMGIVSATGRTNLGIEDYEDFIQTDAPINPGNSGGALVNDRGELVGINTAILSGRSGGNQGIGFAVPVNLARSVMDQILQHGKVTRAYLGIIPQDVSPALAKQFGVKETTGALVGDVSIDSPAAKAGLQRGDIIVALNGKPISGSNELRMSISMMAPESTANLKVQRAGATEDLAVKLGELPTQQEEASNNIDKSEEVLEGVQVENLDAQTAKELGLSSESKGVVVTEINPSSPVAETGLRRGDVIQEVNRQPVKNVSEFKQLMKKSGKDSLLLVNRRGNTLFLAA